MRHIVALCAAALAVMSGCGGGRSGPTDASGIPSVQPVSVVSGRTGQQIPSLSGLTALPGTALHLEAAGFFTYHTAFNGGPVTLWPADDGFITANHSRTLVYSGSNPGTLIRLPASVTAISFVPDAGIRAFSWAMVRLGKAADTLSESHEALDFSVDGEGFPVSLKVDVRDGGFTKYPGAAALTYTRTSSDGAIVEARIVFRSLQVIGFWHTEENFETSVVHEGIHATGINHSGPQDPPGIMSATAESYQFSSPTPYERLVMAMHYRRQPGTTLAGMAESDPGVSVKSEKSKWRLVCAR